MERNPRPYLGEERKKIGIVYDTPANRSQWHAWKRLTVFDHQPGLTAAFDVDTPLQTGDAYTVSFAAWVGLLARKVEPGIYTDTYIY